MGSRLSVGAALVALAGAAVASYLLPQPPGPLRGQAAAEAFVAAWEGSRLGTYVVESTFTRTLADGRVLEGTTMLAQRPPDRLEVGLGSVEGRRRGRRVDCTTTPAGELRCTPGVEVGDYGDSVAEEIRRLRPYVLGSRPLYTVVGDGRGCFALTLALDHPSPPWGQAALFCFDRASGAPTLSETRRVEAVDRTRAVAIRTTVLEADLTVPDDAGELLGS